VTGHWAARTARIEEPTQSMLLHFAGHTFEPLPSGALYWPAERALLVADLHLEKLSSYAPRGRLLPPYDTALTLRRLEADVGATGASEVIALGDSFHRDEGASTLSDADRLRLVSLLGRAHWTWIAGNHDPAPHGFGAAVPFLERAGLTLTHVPRRGPRGLVAGHLHPAATVHVNGRSARRPCFVHDGRTLVLPAYGSATGTLNIVDPAFSGLFDWSALEVVMIGRGRVYPVSPRRLVSGYESW
jgi:DNA ligase-associated metallophosphoesterase